MMKQLKVKTQIRILTLLMGLFLSVGAFAQTDVRGHVKDASGEPVIGATVRVAGQDGGVITDFDGNFSIKAKPGDKIQVTYIGYKTAEVQAKSGMMITLEEDAHSLSDVVVIGYGRAKKTDLTGSVTAVKPDEMSKGITNNASDMMVGKIAGVDVITAGGSPGAGAQIRIRGGASLSASNDPLYVIDGLPVDNNTATGMTSVLSMINPGDIETFTVLKDASATAIYGSRASNGVIIITTKKGRAGQKARISYNGDVTLSTVAKKYDVLTGDQYRALVGSMDGLDASLLGNANTDWQDQIFRTAISTSHNLSIAGGTKNMPYRVSVGFNASDGIIKTSWMRRATGSVNLAPSFLDDHLTFNITAKYMYEKNRYVDAGAAVGSALAMDPTRPVYGSGDIYNKVTGGYYQNLQPSSGFADPEWTQTTNLQSPQNPLAYLNQYKDLAGADDLSGNVEADYKIHGFEDLHIHASYGFQYTDSKETKDWSHQSYSNNYFGMSQLMRYWKYSVTANVYAQYQHTFGAHDIDLMAGAEESHYHRHGFSDVGQGTDPVTGEAYNVTTRAEKNWANHNTLVSYFGRLNYSLLDRYMLTATFRADGSSRFADGNRWGYFPSVALAWKINNEKFLRDVSWIDEAKLRLGWGQTGQQNGIDDFYYTPLYTISDSYAQYPFGDTYYYTSRPSKYNPDLTWETTTTWNAGLDFSFLNGRIAASLDGYYRKTTDLLSTVKIISMMNFGDQLLQNIGDMENYGLELTLNAKPIVTKDFTWDVAYNVSWNHNEITALNASNELWTGETISRGNNTNIMRNAVGHPMSSFFVYQQVYDDNGKPIEGLYVDRNGDGKINQDDRYYYKSPAADVIMGFTTKFTYKRWDFSAAFHASLGNYVYYNFLSDKAAVSASGLYSNSAFQNTTPEALALGFTGTGATEYYLSDYFVRNASYLKCSNMTLGYSFPALLKSGNDEYLSGRVYFNVQNPFIITKYKGIDPEVSSGVDKNPYPRPISFQLGVNLNF